MKPNSNSGHVPSNERENSPDRSRVLIVDDDPAVRHGLADWLGRRQFSVLTAPDLRSAVKMAEEHQPDAILLDVRLGSEDGLRLLGLLREAGLNIPCVVLTGHAGPYDGFKACQQGAIEMLEKPSSPDEIAKALRQAVIKQRSVQFVLHPEYCIPYDLHDPTLTLSTESGLGRADRTGRVLAGLLSSASDAHSLEALCELAPIGVATSTFRRWCRDLRINAPSAVAFARLLRAISLARPGMPPADWLDMDQRTFHKVLAHGGLTELFSRELPSLREFIWQQRLVTNRLVLMSVEKRCSSYEKNVVQKDHAQ